LSPAPNPDPQTADLPDPEHCLDCARDFLGRIQATNDLRRSLEFLWQATHCLGAEVALLATYLHGVESGDSFRMMLACDPQWSTEYERLGSYVCDPWLSYAMRHSEPIRSFELPMPTHAERALTASAETFGFRSVVIVPAPAGASRSRVGMLCLGSSSPHRFEGAAYPTFKLVARGVAMELHEWWLQSMAQALLARTGITERERGLLSRLAAGDSTKAIARAAGQSTAAVHSQIQRLKGKLGVPDRRQAIRIAADNGLLD